jgi:hypothetical protein
MELAILTWCHLFITKAESVPAFNLAPRQERMLETALAARTANTGTTQSSLVIFRPRPVYTRGKSPRSSLNRGLGEPQRRT